jgi:AcrR family transcriptional regulator
MPIQVDVSQRRADIAAATFRVAARDGFAAVTLRSVAGEMGVSTTAITNYLPTRADLLLNAVERMTDEWLAELEACRLDREPRDALRAVMREALTWDQDELVRSQFWVAVLGTESLPIRRRVGEMESAVRDVLAKVVDECGHPEADAAADQLFLLAQGVAASIVEAPGRWPPERLLRVADVAVDGVLAALD